MRTFRNVAVCAMACALVSAAPTRGVQPRATPAQPTPAPKPGDPKWVESMQQLVKDLTDDNLKLRREVSDLRDQRDFLNRKLEECRALLQKREENRGTLVIPPEALRKLQPQGTQPQGNRVPESWKPFEFNGATYYVIPLKEGEAAAGRGNLLLETPAQGRPAVAKPTSPVPTK